MDCELLLGLGDASLEYSMNQTRNKLQEKHRFKQWQKSTQTTGGYYLSYYRIVIIKCVIIMQSNKISEYFTDNLVFSNIAEYLTIKDLLALSSTNKEVQSIVDGYTRNMLMQLKMKPATHKSAIHQMQFYFNRCLRIAKQDNPNQQNNYSIITIDDPFKFETISFFEVGTTYTCYLTRDEKARIFRTSALLHYFQGAKQYKKHKGIPPQKVQYQIRNGVRSIRCKSDQAVITKTNGEVTILTTNKNEDLILTNEQPIEWTSRVPIKQVTNSFNYTIFYPEANAKLKTLLVEIFSRELIERGIKDDEPEDKTYLLARNMLNNKQFIIEISCFEIIQSTVGSKYAYFISDKNQLFEADLEENYDKDYPVIKAKIFEPLKGKTIVEISNGYNYYIALERNVQILEQWDTQRVVQWLRDIGFQPFVKIARYQKLDGKKLKNIEKKYMHNVLGITTQNMQQKFMMSIEENLQKKTNNDKLYGWGKNQSGQLGSHSANFVSKPQKIRFNCLKEGQYIDSIFCGWFQTFIRTQKGRIYCTMTKSQKRRKYSAKDQQQQSSQEQKIIHQTKEQLSQDEDELFEKVAKKSNRKKSNKSQSQNQKKRKKKTVQNQSHIQKQNEKNNRKFEQEQNWYESSFGKAFFVQTYKDVLFLIQCPVQNKQEMFKTKKLRTAKAILDKILWSNLNKQQFKVGYMDKDMGLIEASALDMQKFDVKQNRIKYFKRNSTIIWDRDNKLDIF